MRPHGTILRTSRLKASAPTLQHLFLYLQEPVYPETEQEKAWSDAVRTVKTYSDELVVRWNADIDTYHVFAGLFSAILTAYNGQSYPLLQPPSPDPNIAILSQISLQLSSFTTQPSYTNSTRPAFASALPRTAPLAPTSLVWITTLCFSSLNVSISSAYLGMMVKQWLNEYKSGLLGDSLELVELRRYRLNNLVKWRVERFVIAIPVLLQPALVMFLLGLVVLLWTLHRPTAAFPTVLAGVFVASVAITSVLSLTTPGCA
ncbi:hypothetical protein FKP32DRAFT_1675519 [Trametes sanguinea]|nr:hypothetical protein FKP32DRAFT_1675519 [Trametes sanguinea]